MHETDEVPVVVLCRGVRQWVASPEDDGQLRSSGAWPEQAVRNLTRRMGLRRGERSLRMRLVLPSDVEDQLERYKARRRACDVESRALRRELADIAARLLILGVRQRRTADYLEVKPQRLQALLLTRARPLRSDSRDLQEVPLETAE